VTTFLLIRHAEHDLLGHTLAGRQPTVHLNPAGKIQADRLPQRLATYKIDTLYSGPLERARETAWPLASSAGLELQIANEFDEIDFGEWTGKSFDALSIDRRWHQWNAWRSAIHPPSGECMLRVQARLVGKLHELHEQIPNGCVAVVSHGDVIKALVAHYAGIPLDLFHRIEISPASVSVLTLNDDGPRIMLVNGTDR
jgi:broad specificity phosphatase PhoE